MRERGALHYGSRQWSQVPFLHLLRAQMAQLVSVGPSARNTSNGLVPLFDTRRSSSPSSKEFTPRVSNRSTSKSKAPSAAVSFHFRTSFQQSCHPPLGQPSLGSLVPRWRHQGWSVNSVGHFSGGDFTQRRVLHDHKVWAAASEDGGARDIAEMYKFADQVGTFGVRAMVHQASNMELNLRFCVFAHEAMRRQL